uniref:Zn(2)-C6 fungal-type domain-containing protein n=1 Tax=Psilocybe cubensis TaxID=181762 RepID=A0A8H7XTR1_PSICU
MSTFTTYADSAQGATSVMASTTVNVNLLAADSQPSSTSAGDDDAGKKKKTTKRRKVNHACLYCRRSHMTCDEGRPCQRCIKREIGHLCHDERRPKVPEKPVETAGVPVVDIPRTYAPVPVYQGQPAQSTSTWPMSVPTYMYTPETFGNEFSVLTDFLETLDDGSFFSPPATIAPSLVSSASFPSTTANIPATNQAATPTTTLATGQLQAAIYPGMVTIPATAEATTTTATASATQSTENILPAATKTEKFLLTAADQESGSRDERLNRVIRSKYEAGLLKPYNYVKGYARLSRWMDRNVSQESKQQILQPLSVLRPKFRAVAQSLRDLDLVFIEEAFERMLLDYDRVFSAMGVPACLWRRTGEIYKGNREFTELVGVDGYMMRDGRLCIYELMAEESAVNYWEKYGHVAFDSSQKAVLTSCVLRYKPVLNTSTTSPVISKATTSGTPSASGTSALVKKEDEEPQAMEEGFINCCFSFTIRRDKWGIPSMIVGNFIQC